MNVVATVVVMLVIFFSLDTWLTAVCLAVVLLSFALQFSISWEEGTGVHEYLL